MIRFFLFITILVTVSCASGRLIGAQETHPPDDDSTQIIVVLGAEGMPEFGEQFGQWGKKWDEVAERSGATLTWVGRSAVGQETDREQLRLALRNIPPTRTAATWIVLIGHGTYARQTAKFNLRGPDVSATQLAQWLTPIQSPLVIVNCSSSSGPFINRLSGKNRVIVTATKSGTQYNFSRFGKFFVEAITAFDSDLDHDDEVSVQEAFVRANREVQQFYLSQNRIATEQALIDDNGDSRGTPAKMFHGVRPVATAKDGSPLDGKFASKITLSPNGNPLVLTSDEKKQRAELEKQLDELREKKQTITPDEYRQSIEPVLIQLAKIYQAAEGRAAKD